MPLMPKLERVLCRSTTWGVFARHIVLPWALDGTPLRGAVLEIGSGGGAMAAHLLATHPGITLTALDPDPATVRAAARRLAPFGPRARALEGDATALPFESGSFDAVVSFLMLHHVVTWEAALSEASRVLRPEGRLAGYDLLDTAPGRAFHQAEAAPVRLATEDELQQALHGLPLHTPRVRPRLAGLAASFTASRLAAVG